MKSVSTQLFDFLQANYGQVFASGEIQRMIFKNKNGTTSTPRSLVRRLEELCADGKIQVSYVGKHAHYSCGEKKKEHRFIPFITPDGRRAMREIVV